MYENDPLVQIEAMARKLEPQKVMGSDHLTGDYRHLTPGNRASIVYLLGVIDSLTARVKSLEAKVINSSIDHTQPE